MHLGRGLNIWASGYNYVTEGRNWILDWEFTDLDTLGSIQGVTPAVTRAEIKPQQSTLSTLVNHAANTLLPTKAFNGDNSLWGLPVEGQKTTNIGSPADLTDGGVWTATDITPTKVATDPSGAANNAWKLVSANGTADIENNNSIPCNNKVVQAGLWARIDPAASSTSWTMDLILKRADDAESFTTELALTKTWAYFPIEKTFTNIAVVDDSLQFKIVTGDGATTPPDINVFLPWAVVDSSVFQSPVLSTVSEDQVAFAFDASLRSELSGAQGTIFCEFVPLNLHTDATVYFMLYLGPIMAAEAASRVSFARSAGGIGAELATPVSQMASVAISAANCGRGNIVRMAIKWDATAMKCFMGGAQAGATVATPTVGDATLPAGAGIALQLGAIMQKSIVRRIKVAKHVFSDNYLIDLTR